MRASLYAYIERCGIEFDVAVNVLFGGQLSQTVSFRAALAQRAGKTWGCVFCKILSVLVQRDHCADQFIPGSSTPATFIRAGLAFGAAFLGLWLGFKELARLI